MKIQMVSIKIALSLTHLLTTCVHLEYVQRSCRMMCMELIVKREHLAIISSHPFYPCFFSFSNSCYLQDGGHVRCPGK